MCLQNALPVPIDPENWFFQFINSKIDVIAIEKYWKTIYRLKYVF